MTYTSFVVTAIKANGKAIVVQFGELEDAQHYAANCKHPLCMINMCYQDEAAGYMQTVGTYDYQFAK